MPKQPAKSTRTTRSASKTKVKQTVKASVPAKVEPQAPLSTVQQFFIKGNMEILKPYEIAAHLGVTVDTVTAYIQSVQKSEGTSRANKLMQRPARGVVAMTEAASMVADDFKKRGVITQAEINRAAAAGDFEGAARLARQREEQNVTTAMQDRAKYGDRWHFIREDEPQR